MDDSIHRLERLGTPFSIITSRWLRLEMERGNGKVAFSDPLIQDLLTEIGQTNGTLQIFCDGSALKNGASDAKAGYGIYVTMNDMPAHSYSAKVPHNEPQTNQRAELYALQYALHYAGEHGQSAQIYTDSKYAIQCVTTWGKKWEKDGWKKSDSKPILHLDLIRPMIELWKGLEHKVTIEHVKAHSGGADLLSLGNAEADRLARSSSSS